MGHKLIPDKHIQSTSVQLVVTGTRSANNLYPINIADPKGYKFVNQKFIIPTLTFSGTTYTDIEATIHLVIKQIANAPDEYFLYIDNSVISPIIPISTVIEIMVPFAVRNNNEVVSLQDIFNILGKTSPQYSIDNKTFYGGIDNLIGVGSTNSGGVYYYKQVAEFPLTQLRNRIEEYLEFIDNTAQIVITFPKITGENSILSVIDVYKNPTTNEIVSNYKLVPRNNEFHGDLFTPAFSVCNTADNSKLGIWEIDVRTNRPLSGLTVPIQNLYDTVRVYIKRVTDEVPVFTASTKTIIKPFKFRTATDTRVNFILPNNTVKIGTSNGGTETLVLDFNELTHGGLLTVNSSLASVNPTFSNKPVDFNPVASNKSWVVRNTFIETVATICIQEIIVFADNSKGQTVEIYRRTNNGSVWSAWTKSINHTHSADDIITTTNKQFVSQAQIDAWNALTATTWLPPVQNITDLALITSPAIGSAVVVRSENMIYIYIGGAIWRKQHELASSTNDGLLSASLYDQIMLGLGNTDITYKKNLAASLLYLNQHNQNDASYGGLMVTDAVMRQTEIASGFSDKSVAYGLNTEDDGTGAILGASDYSTMVGVDNHILDSIHTTVFGSLNKVNGKNYTTAIGSGLDTTITKMAIGTFNKGTEFFEIGVGESNIDKRNLVAFSALGQLMLNEGIVTDLVNSPAFDTMLPSQYNQLVFNAAGGLTNISSLLGVDINNYSGTFGERLQAAINDSLDDTVLDVRHAIADSVTGGINQFIIDYTKTPGITINKPLKIILPSGDIVFSNYSTGDMTSYHRHMFNIELTGVKIYGSNRLPNGGSFKATRLHMAQNYGGYHIYGENCNNITIRDLNLIGCQTSSVDAQESSTSKPINGAGGIFFTTDLFNSTDRITSIRIESVSIFNSKYHAIYLGNSLHAYIDDVYIERGGAHAIFINGGDGIQIKNTGVNITHKGGIVLFNHNIGNVLNTQVQLAAISYFVHNCNNVSFTSTASKTPGNKGNTIPNGGITFVDRNSITQTITDVASTHTMLFKGSGYVVTDSICVNLMNVLSVDAGRPSIGGAAVDARDILVRGSARDVVITIPQTALTSGSSFTGRFNIAFEQFGGETPLNCELVYNPMNSGTVTPGVPTQWISNINNDANKAPVFMEANSNILVRSGRMFFTDLIGVGFGPLEWTEQSW